MALLDGNVNIVYYYEKLVNKYNYNIICVWSNTEY